MASTESGSGLAMDRFALSHTSFSRGVFKFLISSLYVLSSAFVLSGVAPSELCENHQIMPSYEALGVVNSPSQPWARNIAMASADSGSVLAVAHAFFSPVVKNLISFLYFVKSVSAATLGTDTASFPGSQPCSYKILMAATDSGSLVVFLACTHMNLSLGVKCLMTSLYSSRRAFALDRTAWDDGWMANQVLTASGV